MVREGRNPGRNIIQNSLESKPWHFVGSPEQAPQSNYSPMIKYYYYWHLFHMLIFDYTWWPHCWPAWLQHWVSYCLGCLISCMSQGEHLIRKEARNAYHCHALFSESIRRPLCRVLWASVSQICLFYPSHMTGLPTEDLRVLRV